MPLMTTTSYRLPHLRYLQTRWLVATWLYVGLYYLGGGVLLASAIIGVDDQYLSQHAWFWTCFFLLLGINVMWQLVRIAVAGASKWQWHDATQVAQYQLDISPIEAAVLLDARSPKDTALLILQSLLDKNAIRLVPKGSRIQVVDCYEDEKPLYDYESYLTSLLLKDGASPLMSRRQLVRGRHIVLTERFIYEKMMRYGYFAKQSPLQEGLGQYLRIGSYYVAGLAVALPLILTQSQARVESASAIPQSDWVILLSSIIVVTLLVPLLLYVRNLFTRYGTDKMSLALGFYWYLRTVYKHRLAHGYQLTQGEERQYGPYLDSFGIRKREKVIHDL